LDAVTREDGERAAELYRAYHDRFSETDTDVMRAHVLVAFADDRIRYAPGLGFFVWDGRCWVPSETLVRQEVYRLGAALAFVGKAKEARSFLMTKSIDHVIRELRDVLGCVSALAISTRVRTCCLSETVLSICVRERCALTAVRT
jgi:hypothetical protein